MRAHAASHSLSAYPPAACTSCAPSATVISAELRRRTWAIRRCNSARTSCSVQSRSPGSRTVHASGSCTEANGHAGVIWLVCTDGGCDQTTSSALARAGRVHNPNAIHDTHLSHARSAATLTTRPDKHPLLHACPGRLAQRTSPSTPSGPHHHHVIPRTSKPALAHKGQDAGRQEDAICYRLPDSKRKATANSAQRGDTEPSQDQTKQVRNPFHGSGSTFLWTFPKECPSPALSPAERAEPEPQSLAALTASGRDGGGALREGRIQSRKQPLFGRERVASGFLADVPTLDPRRRGTDNKQE
ncbi:uncharacterized protein CC84DRAFT_1176313 [Paraphaeosphaeria sporulosa]|uniref:Uncharacterized protein n=1 Tax=Paraphaeosphaeria sporulosa TaxID=1460663 RepID=A0A177CF94_9PLEO|nr:uncharacterized protein CC84DRAFT_1176313 [Paraphaeosphaeria sporulosa]OAG06284.1 hypothetical protein CC84DRAFT_1176313 [Paraphaeosphaeria sporulosa]